MVCFRRQYSSRPLNEQLPIDLLVAALAKLRGSPIQIAKRTLMVLVLTLKVALGGFTAY